jgi:hypothetical protein
MQKSCDIAARSRGGVKHRSGINGIRYRLVSLDLSAGQETRGRLDEFLFRVVVEEASYRIEGARFAQGRKKEWILALARRNAEADLVGSFPWHFGSRPGCQA